MPTWRLQMSFFYTASNRKLILFINDSKYSHLGREDNVRTCKYVFNNTIYIISVCSISVMDCESTHNETVVGFRELETLYPNCESVTRAWQESGGGGLSVNGTKETWAKKKCWCLPAKLWCERNGLPWLFVLVHWRKQLLKTMLTCARLSHGSVLTV